MKTQSSKVIAALQSIGCKAGDVRPVLSSVYVQDGTAWATNGKTLLALPCTDHPSGIWPTKQFTPSDHFPLNEDGTMKAIYPKTIAVIPPQSSYRGEPTLITEKMESELHAAAKDPRAYISWAIQYGFMKFNARKASDLIKAIRKVATKGDLHIQLTATYEDKDVFMSPMVITGKGVTHALLCSHPGSVAVKIPWTAPVAKWQA